MRAGKYRAWHIPTRRMLYFDRLWICTEYDSIAFELADSSRQEEYSLWAGHSHLPSKNVAEYIFMQYTDLPDKNGTEICEGDIMRRDYPAGYSLDEVKFGFYDNGEDYEAYEGGYGWYMQGVSYYKDGSSDNRIHGFDGYPFNEGTSEVVGNRNENPELLKEVK